MGGRQAKQQRVYPIGPGSSADRAEGIAALPAELLGVIGRMLDFPSLCALARTSKLLYTSLSATIAKMSFARLCPNLNWEEANILPSTKQDSDINQVIFDLSNLQQDFFALPYKKETKKAMKKKSEERYEKVGIFRELPLYRYNIRCNISVHEIPIGGAAFTPRCIAHALFCNRTDQILEGTILIKAIPNKPFM